MPHPRSLNLLALLAVTAAATSCAQPAPTRGAGAVPDPAAASAGGTYAVCPPGPNQANCIERLLRQMAEAAKAIASCSEGSCGPGPVYQGKLMQVISPAERQIVARGLATFALSQGITQQDLVAAFKR